MNIYFVKTALVALQMAFGQDVATSHASISVADMGTLYACSRCRRGIASFSVSTSTTDMGKVYACPRCRRAKPPGPLKRPHPGFHNKEKNNDQ